MTQSWPERVTPYFSSYHLTNRDVLNPDENWHLRLAGGTIDGHELGTAGKDLELCVRIARAKEHLSCTRLTAPDAGTHLASGIGAELLGYGLELELRDSADGGAPRRALSKRKMTRLLLCQGFDVDLLSADGGAAPPAKLRFYLDDPTSPSESCSAPR